jgi:hypothetical protein
LILAGKKLEKDMIACTEHVLKCKVDEGLLMEF